jgi:capsid protein
MAGYSEAEIVAARAAAQPIGWEEPSDFPNPEAEQQEDGTFETPYEPGFVHHGKKLNFYSPNRPNTALPDFIRHMLKEAASGIGYGVRYAALSGDYSQANYSSERAAILDDRDGWRALQQFFIRSFRYRTHRMWLQQGVFAQSIPGISVAEYMADREKFEAVKFKPRGWNWIDPTAEVAAYKDAEMAGYITKTRIIEMTSDNTDIEDVFTERRRELDAAADQDLQFNTDPSAATSDRSKAEEYGVSVRAGAVTPQIEDEEAFRAELALPPLSDDAKRAWQEDKGIRRPITLRDPNEKKQSFGGDQSDDDESDDPSEEGRQMRLVK